MPGKGYGWRVALLVCWEDLCLDSQAPRVSLNNVPGNSWLWFLLQRGMAAVAAAEACSVRPRSQENAGPSPTTRERRSCLIFPGAFSPLSMPPFSVSCGEGSSWQVLPLTGSMPKEPLTHCLSQASQVATGISKTLDYFIPQDKYGFKKYFAPEHKIYFRSTRALQ